MEKETLKMLIAIRWIMEFIDDGYHNDYICTLTKLSNELLSKVSPENQKKFQEWVEERIKSEEEES